MQIECVANAVATINLEGIKLMKKLIGSIACCALMAPLAFGKDTKQTRPWHFAFITERPVTVTATSPNIRVEGGAAAVYQPAGTLVVHQDGPGLYILEARGRVFNNRGEIMQGAVRPGTRMHVYFTKDDAGVQSVDHIVVD